MLFSISKQALRKHVEENFGGWDEQEQRDMFFRSTDPQSHELFYLNDEPIGFWWVERRDDEIYLNRISILPAHQNQGIGTHLIRRLIQEGGRQSRPVRLQVFPNNPARRIYQRIGFQEEDHSETHVHMIYAVHCDRRDDG
ncbi:MAG: GNAT family N-acetyltransferase [Verrucomicrobiales bacterium]|nr:GNAT family N-acetyltransferase [Verrucomicrobiales bacterium]